MRLRVADWLGRHLPFDWAPRWVNHALARWMWRTPGFDVPGWDVDGTGRTT